MFDSRCVVVSRLLGMMIVVVGGDGLLALMERWMCHSGLWMNWSNSLA